MSHAMFIFFLFTVTVFLELLILYLFFEKIYRFAAGDRSGGGEGHDHSFSFLIGKVIIYLKWRFAHREGSESTSEYSYSEEMNTFLTANSDMHGELLGNLLLLISGIILAGAVTGAYQTGNLPAGNSGRTVCSYGNCKMWKKGC